MDRRRGGREMGGDGNYVIHPRSPWLPRQYAYAVAMGLRLDDSDAVRSAKLLTATVGLYLMAHCTLCAIVPFLPGVRPALPEAHAYYIAAVNLGGLLMILAGLFHYSSTGALPLFRGMVSCCILLTSAAMTIGLHGVLPVHLVAIVAPIVGLCTSQTTPITALQAGTAVAVLSIGSAVETRPDLFFSYTPEQRWEWHEAVFVAARVYCLLVVCGGTLGLMAYATVPREDVYPPPRVRQLLEEHQHAQQEYSEAPAGTPMSGTGSARGDDAASSTARSIHEGDDEDESRGGMRLSLKATTGIVSAMMFLSAGVILTLLVRRVYEISARQRGEAQLDSLMDTCAFITEYLGGGVSTLLNPQWLHDHTPHLSYAYATWSAAGPLRVVSEQRGDGIANVTVVHSDRVSVGDSFAVAALDARRTRRGGSRLYTCGTPGAAAGSFSLFPDVGSLAPFRPDADHSDGGDPGGYRTLNESTLVVLACADAVHGITYYAAVSAGELVRPYVTGGAAEARLGLVAQLGDDLPPVATFSSEDLHSVSCRANASGVQVPLAVTVTSPAVERLGGESFAYLLVWLVVAIGSCCVSLAGSFIFEPIKQFALAAHDYSTMEESLEQLRLPTGGYSELIVLKWAFTRLANTIIKAKMFLPIASLGALEEEGDVEDEAEVESMSDEEDGGLNAQLQTVVSSSDAALQSGAGEPNSPAHPLAAKADPAHPPPIPPPIQRVSTPRELELRPNHSSLSANLSGTASHSSAASLRLRVSSGSQQQLSPVAASVEGRLTPQGKASPSAGDRRLSPMSRTASDRPGSPGTTSSLHTPNATRAKRLSAAAEAREKERDDFMCLKRGPGSPKSPKNSRARQLSALRPLRQGSGLGEVGKAGSPVSRPETPGTASPQRIRKAVRFTPETKVPHMTLTHDAAVLAMNVNSFHTVMKNVGKKSFDYFSQIFSAAMATVASCGGISVSITGDRMLAIWKLTKAVLSCHAALKFHEAIKHVGGASPRGSVQISARIGIAGGRITWGNFSLTQPDGRIVSIVNMLGHTVNKAVALERLNKDLFSVTLIEGALRDTIREHSAVLFRPVEIVLFKHSRRNAPSSVYEVLLHTDPTVADTEDHPALIRAFRAARNQDWAAAEAELEAEHIPVNRSVARLFTIVRGRRPPLEIE
eukprot:TRINITY_DN19699_c0_g1_i1.p1 TRINITY_DN19699_c0_g1~~TRINITY_DN19699_c0_g1_i1.p1  ORF type:complete len:1159 (+),score=311.95 TRINITY_DN19699_c0_g1_i1:97-3573(+)